MCLRFDICSSQREIIHIGFVSLCGRVGVRVNDEICRINKSVFPENSHPSAALIHSGSREWIFESVDDVIIIGSTLSPALFFYLPFPWGDGEIKKALGSGEMWIRRKQFPI
jgi:hypothetical protein